MRESQERIEIYLETIRRFSPRRFLPINRQLHFCVCTCAIERCFHSTWRYLSLNERAIETDAYRPVRKMGIRACSSPIDAPVTILSLWKPDTVAALFAGDKQADPWLRPELLCITCSMCTNVCTWKIANPAALFLHVISSTIDHDTVSKEKLFAGLLRSSSNVTSHLNPKYLSCLRNYALLRNIRRTVI